MTKGTIHSVTWRQEKLIGTDKLTRNKGTRRSQNIGRGKTTAEQKTLNMAKTNRNGNHRQETCRDKCSTCRDHAQQTEPNATTSWGARECRHMNLQIQAQPIQRPEEMGTNSRDRSGAKLMEHKTGRPDTPTGQTGYDRQGGDWSWPANTCCTYKAFYGVFLIYNLLLYHLPTKPFLVLRVLRMAGSPPASSQGP